MKKKYTHLFFDLDNTLWDFTSNSKQAMESTFKKLQLEQRGISFSDFFEVYQENNHKLWAAYRNKAIKKKELTKQRFQLTFDTFGIKGIDALAMNDLYLTEMPKQKCLMEGAIQLLDHLKGKGYKLYIITNGFSEVQHKKLQNSGLASYFEKVFISEELKCPKPGRAIFEHAIKSANAKKTNSLMIGDDWGGDVLGAVNFGIDVVYFNPLGSSDKQKKHEIESSAGKIRENASLHNLLELL